MNIKKSVINTFERVGIDYKMLQELKGDIEVRNWITGVPCVVTPLIAECIKWVYMTQLEYEQGNHSTKVSDFDRVRYFILEQDKNAWSVCID